MARGRFVRDNIFLVAAVSLPLVVVAFFLLSAVLPRWLVPPPTYDLLLRTRTYDQTAARIAVDITVNGDRVEARARGVSRDAYLQRPILWLFEHKTLTVRQIPLDLPTWLDEREPPQTIAIDALKGRRVLPQTKAPDGYELRTRSRGGPGIVGDLFGMHRYDQTVSIVNRGRVVSIALPRPYEYESPEFVAWLADEGGR